ncbi:Chymotrypsin-2 [Halotydeus destructor]|nr:Chymotrypsin-2 [Halotydeus destructor]
MLPIRVLIILIVTSSGVIVDVDGQQRENCTCGLATGLTGRVVNGSTVRSNQQFPWIGGLFLKEFPQWPICVVTVVSRRWMITAEHCLSQFKANQLQVAFGEVDSRNFRNYYDIANIVIPIQSRGRYLDNDIAMIRINETLEWTNFVRPICLPEINQTISGVTSNLTSGSTVGWGRLSVNGTKPNLLQHIMLTALPLTNCSGLYTRVQLSEQNINLCLYNRTGNLCNGDSGSPLMTLANGTTYMTGLASFTEYRCRPGFPVVFISTIQFLDIIYKTASDDRFCRPRITSTTPVRATTMVGSTTTVRATNPVRATTPASVTTPVSVKNNTASFSFAGNLSLALTG